MKTLKTLCSLCLMALCFMACEQDDFLEQQEETIITANSTASLEAVIIGNRNKIKERPGRNYNSILFVDDATNSVTTALVQYTPLEGENPFPETLEMEVSTIRKSIRKMQKTQAMSSDTDLFPAGRPFQQTVTLYNELGEPVGDTSETWVTAQDNDGTTVNRIESNYLTPTSIAIPVRLRTDQPEGITVFARVELYGRILIKGEALEMEMTVYDETEGNIGLTGTAVAQVEALTGGSDILPGDELQISITTIDANGEIIDEDYFITPIEIASSYNAVKSSKTIVFGQTTYLETRVSIDAGEDIAQITATVFQQGEQNFEPFTIDLFPVSSNENTIKFRSIAHTNPTFVGQEDAFSNILHQLIATDTEGNTIEEVTLLAPTTVLDGITRNPKHIIKPNGTTRIRIGLKNPIAQEVAYASIQIPSDIITGQNDDVAFFEVNNTDGGIYRIDGDFVYSYISNSPDGLNYTSEIILYNIENQPIGVEQVVFEIEDQRETSNIILNNSSLYQNTDGTTFTLSLDIMGDYANEVAAVAVFITPQDGGSDADPENFILEFEENTFDGKLFSNHFVTFGDPDTVIGYSYNTELTFLNTDGDELDYLEVQIVGENRPEKTATLCMANGETPSEFSLTIETNDSNAQDLDALRIEFLNNGELFTIAQSYDMIRTESSDHTVTFSTSGIEFTDLNLVEEGLMVLSSPYTDLPYSSTISFNATALKQYPLGYYNEETGKWECEDDCLEPDDSGQMCGETDHL